MNITHYMVTASKRGAENITHTYCKTAVGFTTDDLVADIELTEGEADAQYAAQAADGSPYNIVSKISVDEFGTTEVISEKRI